MALSNLIWWPWFGKGAEEPIVAELVGMGDRRPQHEVVRRHPIDEDDVEELEALIAVILTKV